MRKISIASMGLLLIEISTVAGIARADDEAFNTEVELNVEF